MGYLGKGDRGRRRSRTDNIGNALSIWTAFQKRYAKLKLIGHPNAGKVFLNWFLSLEGQIAFRQAHSARALAKISSTYQPA